MATPFYAHGLKFKCQQCSHCCCDEPGFVYLSKQDLTNLCEYFALKADVFIKKYCRWVPYHDNTIVLSLKETKKYDCILWNKGCMAYDARPVQCKTYPFWPFLLKDKKVWENEQKECPGINEGTLYSAKKIEKIVNEYDSIEILRYTIDTYGGS
ncbi:MAG TPA: YkgJ family cysteine cluster protein [Treponemataceae bacterium]|nr:YkgJ family cysteine cluster protein [Treponemataceae bacterium]